MYRLHSVMQKGTVYYNIQTIHNREYTVCAEKSQSNLKCYLS